MSDLFGNHIVGFPTRRLISHVLRQSSRSVTCSYYTEANQHHMAVDHRLRIHLMCGTVHLLHQIEIYITRIPIFCDHRPQSVSATEESLSKDVTNKLCC